MRVAVDISLYPLSDEFIAPIVDFIDRLNTHGDMQVVTNAMSTQIRGEFDVVMRALQHELGTTFEHIPKAVFVIKILNNPLEK